MSDGTADATPEDTTPEDAAPEDARLDDARPHWRARLVGRYVWRPWLDALVTAGLSGVFFPLSRAWAIGLAADGDRARFMAALPLRVAPPGLDALLARLAERGRRFRTATAAWEAALFGRTDGGMVQRVAAADAWDAAAFHMMQGRADMLPLRLLQRLPAVGWNIPPPAEVAAALDARSAGAGGAFALPAAAPEIESSHPVLRRGRREIFARFPSPVAAVGDSAWAHVYEPADGAAATVVYCDGLGVESEFWPDPRDPVAFCLRHGLRVLRFETPWHGRRRRPGTYGGEPVLSRAPLGVLDFFHAGIVEAGLWTAWARARFGGPVGLAGMSLGALIAAKLATLCGDWPEASRPDALLLLMPGDNFARIAFEGSLMTRIGLGRELREAGWTETDLRRLAPFAEPQGPPAIAPGHVLAVLGSADRLTHYEDAAAMLARWGVPEENLFVARRGHFTTNFALGLDQRPFARLRALLAPEAAVSPISVP